MADRDDIPTSASRRAAHLIVYQAIRVRVGGAATQPAAPRAVGLRPPVAAARDDERCVTLADSYLLCSHFGDEAREAAKRLERRADEGERLLAPQRDRGQLADFSPIRSLDRDGQVQLKMLSVSASTPLAFHGTMLKESPIT